MKLCIVGDLHFCSSSSIVRGKGINFSTRLESCVSTLNYVESTAYKLGCEYIVYLGDFFDNPYLSGEEITALQSVVWSPLPRVMLVGNHEMITNDLTISSAHLFNLVPNSTVIDCPNALKINSKTLFFLPYVVEESRKDLSFYIKDLLGDDYDPSNTIVFSHNAIQGIRMGKFESTVGFDKKDIESSCCYFINGHIHNGAKISDKILDVGNVNGLNFSEDAEIYPHQIYILDTDNVYNIEPVNNPFALNFFKRDVLEKSDIEYIRTLLSRYSNVVLSIRCSQQLYPTLKLLLEEFDNIVAYRITQIMDVNNEKNDSDLTTAINTQVDYKQEFIDYILEYMGNNEQIKEELSIIVG